MSEDTFEEWLRNGVTAVPNKSTPIGYQLQSAHKRSGSAERQAAIQQLIQAVQVKMSQKTQQAKQS